MGTYSVVEGFHLELFTINRDIFIKCYNVHVQQLPYFLSIRMMFPIMFELAYIDLI